MKMIAYLPQLWIAFVHYPGRLSTCMHVYGFDRGGSDIADE